MNQQFNTGLIVKITFKYLAAIIETREKKILKPNDFHVTING